MRRTQFEIASEEAIKLGTDLGNNPYLSFKEVSVKAAWVWVKPGDDRTRDYILQRGFFANPKYDGFYCFAFIGTRHRSQSTSIAWINHRYGNINVVTQTEREA